MMFILDNYKPFVRLINIEKIQTLDCNLSHHTYNNKKWYSIVIQSIDKNGKITFNICIGSCGIFIYIVSGYVYYYNAYNYIMK